MDKRAMVDYIASKADLIYEVSDKVWDAAETAFEEYKSVDVLCAALEQEGFKVERGVADVKTAFLGRAGSGKPVIGILGEFDALSGLSQVAGCAEKNPLVAGAAGHGCGHNMLGAGSLAAAIGVKQYLENNKLAGTVIFYGTPGEEGGSGKAFMAREGVFDELDLAFCWHPGFVNSSSVGSSLANVQVKYHFKGVSAHAAGDPHLGRSALDAVELMNVGVQFLREHMIDQARVHYAITDAGGYSPNVVQPTATVLYLIRSPKNDQVQELYERVNKIARGAALMTETELEIDFMKGCSNLVPNVVIAGALDKNLNEVPLPEYTEAELKEAKAFADTVKTPAEHMKAQLASAGADEATTERIMAHVEDPVYNFTLPLSLVETVGAGSTDVGDVSWVCPTAQISTSTWAAGTPGHSWQIVAQGKGATAHKATLYAGQVIAGAAVDFIENPELVEKAKAEFDRRLGGGSYACPIPKGIKPRAISGK